MKKSIIICIVLVSVLGVASFSYAVTSNFTPKTSLDEKKEILNERLEEGLITAEQLSEIEEKLENCKGKEQEKIGQEYNICFGKGNSGKNINCTNQGMQNGKKQNQNKANCDGTRICTRVTQ